MKKIFYSFMTCLFITLSAQAATNYSGGNGTKQNPYLISSIDDLEALHTQISYYANYYFGRHFLLTQDLTGLTWPIGGGGTGKANLPFSGTFDGNGHTVEVNIDAGSWVDAGFFSHLQDATVKNLRITGSVYSAYSNVGGICGAAYNSVIDNCVNAADIFNSYYTTAWCGGICGSAFETIITNCLNTGDIASNSASTTSTAGICGFARGKSAIIRCVATNATIMGNSYNSQRIIGNYYDDDDVIIEDCYADGLMKVNRQTIISQDASSKDGKNLETAPFCANRPTVIFLKDAFCALRWERKLISATTWEEIICTDFIYKESTQTPGIFLYRAMLPDGNYTLTLEINYLDAVPNEITITSAAQTVTVFEKLSLSLNLDQSGYEFQWYKEEFEIPNATQSTFTIESVSMQDAGSYRCKVSNPCSSIISRSITIQVNKAPLRIEIMNTERAYGEPNPDFPVWYTGLRYGDTPSTFKKLPSVNTNASINSNAGTYEITVNGAEADNYDITYVNGTLTITKAELKIYAISHYVLTGHSVPAFRLHFDGLKGDDTAEQLDELPTFSCDIPENPSPGEYAINLTGGQDKNYAYSLFKGYVWVMLNNGSTGSIHWELSDSVLSLTGTGEIPDYEYNETQKTYNIPWNYFTHLVGKITMSNDITNLGDYAFLWCFYTNSVTLPSSLQRIGYFAFYGCENIKTLTLPADLRSINNGAFVGCSGLKKISILANVPPVLDAEVFDNHTFNSSVLEVPYGLKSAYENDSQWSRFKVIVEAAFQSAVSKTSGSHIKLCQTINGVDILGLHMGEIVRVFNLSGKLIYSELASSNKLSVALPAKGVYIIQTTNDYCSKYVF